MADLSSDIESAATTPQQARIADRSATARPISELIEADRYLAEKAAASTATAGIGIRFFNTKPPGAVTPQECI